MSWIIAAIIGLTVGAGTVYAARSRRSEAELRAIAARHQDLICNLLAEKKPVAAIRAVRDVEPSLGLADARAVVSFARDCPAT